MRDIIKLAAKVLTGVIIAFAVILTGILIARSDSDMARNIGQAINEIGITLNVFMIGTYVVAGLTLLLVVGFSIYNIFVNPKGAINALIGIGVLVVIIIISYVSASSDIDPLFVLHVSENVEVTDSLSKQVGAGLIATYILAALAVLAILYSTVSKLIKG
jgi:hypothetical protein